MRNLLAFLAAMTLTVAGIGWYLDWYRIRTTPADSGQKSVTVDINTKKIGEDLREAEKKIQQRLAERVNAEAEANNGKKVIEMPGPSPRVNID